MGETNQSLSSTLTNLFKHPLFAVIGGALLLIVLWGGAWQYSAQSRASVESEVQHLNEQSARTLAVLVNASLERHALAVQALGATGSPVPSSLEVLTSLPPSRPFYLVDPAGGVLGLLRGSGYVTTSAKFPQGLHSLGSLNFATAVDTPSGVRFVVSATPWSVLLKDAGILAVSRFFTLDVAFPENRGASLKSTNFNLTRLSTMAENPAAQSFNAKVPSASGSAAIELRLQEPFLLQALDERTVYLCNVLSAFSLAIGLLSLCGVLILRGVKITEQKLINLVTRDALTDLPNRRSLNEMLEQVFRDKADPGYEVGLLFVDLDNFKPVNDTYGHKMGDLLLRAVSHRVTAALGEADTVCRLGGDEFAIVARARGGRPVLRKKAQIVVNCFSEPFVLEGIQVHTGASVGLAYATDCRSSSELLKNADMAMYDAKSAGKGRFREYSVEMAKKALDEEKLSMALRPALRAGEFRMVYQPKVSAYTGAVRGFEALLRWDHPQQGIVGPSSFISLAEASGFIHELGSWVIQKVLDQIKVWAEAGHGLIPVAVNLSAVQLLDPFIVGKIKRMLDVRGLPPSCLQLELTESVLASNIEQANKVLGQLRKMGVRIAIDDFGTGYSSLNSLQQFEVDYLKVDKSFVHKLGDDLGNKICRSIIGLAHSLGTEVIAEGVETEQQVSLLREMGCEELQGFYMSEPVFAEQVPALKSSESLLP